MKTIIRSILSYSGALYLLSLLFEGLSVRGGLSTFLLSGSVLMVLAFTVKPLLSLISFPFHLVTLGVFSFVSNAAILAILTVFVTSVSIHSFVYPGLSFMGFTIPKMAINSFFTYMLLALGLSLIMASLEWLQY